jgi:hypothetical protein
MYIEILFVPTSPLELVGFSDCNTAYHGENCNKVHIEESILVTQLP